MILPDATAQNPSNVNNELQIEACRVHFVPTDANTISN